MDHGEEAVMDRGSVAEWLEEIGLEAYHDLLAVLGIR